MVNPRSYQKAAGILRIPIQGLRSPINWLVSLIKHMVGVALEKSPSRVRKSSDSPDRLSNATESRYRGSNATKVALERL